VNFFASWTFFMSYFDFSFLILESSDVFFFA
jgi:hypothetical protein